MVKPDLEELATAKYWDDRYKAFEATNSQQSQDAADTSQEGESKSNTVTQVDKDYEWFKTFQDLWPWLKVKLPPVETNDGRSPSILHLGNGTSVKSTPFMLFLLPPSLDEKGYKNQTSIDFSEVSCNQMKKQFPHIDWIVGDVTQMPPQCLDRSFDVAIDKGTLDAMLGQGSLWPGQVEDIVLERVGKYSSEVFRTLKDEGLWIYITFRQPHFMKPLLCIDGYWDVEVETIAGETGTGAFEYFGYILRKKKD